MKTMLTQLNHEFNTIKNVLHYWIACILKSLFKAVRELIDWSREITLGIKPLKTVLFLSVINSLRINYCGRTSPYENDNSIWNNLKINLKKRLVFKSLESQPEENLLIHLPSKMANQYWQRKQLTNIQLFSFPTYF